MEKFNFVDVLIDEIALEGLDGITLPSLWIRLESREESQLMVDEGTKIHLWQAVATHCDIDFFRLPEPRPDIEKFNRFECFTEDNSSFLHPENLAAEPYGFKGVDQDGLIGSCPTYATRKNVNSQIRDTNYKCLISLQAALEKWDRSLVMVAKQHRRTFALTQNYLIPNGLDNPTFYLVMEAIGRARKCGIASGKLLPQLSCHMFGFDAKFCFYVTKCLMRLNLIKKQPFPVAYKGKKIGLNVFHLNRFYQRHLGGMEFLKQTLFQYLREQPAHVQELNIVKDIFKLHDNMFLKKIMHQSKGFLSIHRIPYKSFYPNASAEECISKNGNERFIKVLVMDKDTEDKESEEEDDDHITPATHMWNDNYDWQGKKGIMNQVFEYLYKMGAKGSTLKQIAHGLGVNHLLVRQTLKPLFLMKFIKQVMRSEGRMKYTVYIASHFENSGFRSYDKAWEEFQKKTTVTGARVEESSLSLASQCPDDNKNVNSHEEPVKKLRLSYIDSRHSEMVSVKPIQERMSIPREVAQPQSLLEAPCTHGEAKGIPSSRKVIKAAAGSVVITRKKYRRPAIVPTKKKRPAATVCPPTPASNGVECTSVAVSEPAADLPQEEHCDSTCLLPAPDKASGETAGAGGQTRFLSVFGLAEAESVKQSVGSQHQVAASTVDSPRGQVAASTTASPKQTVLGGSQAVVKVTFQANTPWRIWIVHPLVSEKMTESLIRIANMMVDLVSKHRVVDSLTQFRQEIRQHWGKREVCRRTIRRLIEWCEKQKKVTTYYITFECGQKSMQLLLVCAKDVSRDDPLVINVVEQFKLRHFGILKRGHRKQVGAKTVITNWMQLVRLAIKLDKSTHSEELKPKSQRTCRYKKWEKAHLFHRYLWYMVCGYQGTVPENSKSSTSVDVNINDYTDGEIPEPPVYLDVQDWRRYLPPLCKHPEAASNCGRSENVALVGDLLLCMPLSLFVILINGESLSCVREYMEDSVRHHHPLSALPLGILGSLLHFHNYMEKIGAMLRWLSSLGLLAVGLMPYSDRSKQFVYVRKTALLLDTTGSLAGYCQTVLPPGLDAFPEVRFKFEELSDVEHYWHELRRFACFTNLNNKSKTETLAQKDKEEDLVMLEEQCKYKSLDEVPDDYFLPGNRRGAGGTDSYLFMHLKRNWVNVSLKSDHWHKTKNSAKAVAAPKKKETVAILALARARAVENRKVKLAQRSLPASPAPGSVNQGEIRAKLQKTTVWNPSHANRKFFCRIKKRRAVCQPSSSGEKKRQKPECNFDEKDKAASKLKTSDRARFTVREISAVLMGKVAMYFFMGDRGLLDNLSPIRDVMQERLPESINKTRRMLQTCIMRQMKQASVRRSFAHCLIRIRQDKELLEKYQHAVIPLGTHPNAEKINPFIRDLFIDLLEKYLGGELEGVFQLPETLQVLQGRYERVQGEKAIKECQEWADVASDRDVCAMVVRDFQMSHLLSEWDKQGRDYELYNTLHQYPDEMVGDVFHKLKLNQVIAKKKRSRKDCGGDLRSYLLHSRILGILRRAVYPVDLFATAYSSLRKVEEAHANGTALTLPLGSACPGDLGLVVGLMAMDKIQMSMEIGQNVIELKELQDIFKKQDKVQPNRLSLSAKRSHAQMGESSDDSDEEKAGSTICGNLTKEKNETENEFAPLTKQPRTEGEDRPLVLENGATDRAIPPKSKGAKKRLRDLSGSETDSTGDDDNDGNEEWQPPRKKQPRHSKGATTLGAGGRNKGLCEEAGAKNVAKSSDDTMSDFFATLHGSVDALVGALDQVKHRITVKKNTDDDSVQVSTERTNLNISTGDVGLRLVKPNKLAAKCSFSSLSLQRLLPQESAFLNSHGQINQPISIVMSNISLGLKDPGCEDGPAGKSAPCIPVAVPDNAVAAASMDPELPEDVPSFAAGDEKVDGERSVEEIANSANTEADILTSVAKETAVFPKPFPSSETISKPVLAESVLLPTGIGSSALPPAAEQDTANQTSRMTANCRRTGRETSTLQNCPQWLQSFIADQTMAPIAPEILKAVVRKQTKLLPFDTEIPERWEQLREEVGGQAAARCEEVYKAIETGKAIGLTWQQLKVAVPIDEELLYCALETLMDYDLVLRVGVTVFRFVCLAKARCWVIHTLKNNRGRGSSLKTHLEDEIHLEDKEESRNPEDLNPGGKVVGADNLKETGADISQTLMSSGNGDNSTPGNREISLSPLLPESGDTAASLSAVIVSMDEKTREAPSEEACLKLASKTTLPVGGTVTAAAVSENALESERQSVGGSENINDGIGTENGNQRLGHDPGLVGGEAVPLPSTTPAHDQQKQGLDCGFAGKSEAVFLTSTTPERSQQTRGLDPGLVGSEAVPSTLTASEASKGSLGGEQTGKKTRAGRRIAARKWQEKTSQGERKEEDNKLKDLNVSSYKKIRLQSRIWKRPEGGLNSRMLPDILDSMLYHILRFPGSTLLSLSNKYSDLCTPVDLHELLKMLEELGCVRLMVMKKAPSSLFTTSTDFNISYRSTDCLAASPSELTVEPSVDCIHRLGQFFHFIKK